MNIMNKFWSLRDSVHVWPMRYSSYIRDNLYLAVERRIDKRFKATIFDVLYTNVLTPLHDISSPGYYAIKHNIQDKCPTTHQET